jgi:glucose/arabinose dehydrogenase
MDHGSDWFGQVMERKYKDEVRQPITDNNPPCEMNHYVQDGFYGHPYITGNKLPRYEFMNRNDIVDWAAKTIAPAWAAGAHNAPNAMTFYDGNQFPAYLKGDAFVAYHGSWNRSERGGYRVTRVMFEEGRPYGEQRMVDFLNTKTGDFFGRPVDVIVANDGSLLITDDWDHKIYRLSYIGKK